MRKTCEKIKVDTEYRWFLGIPFGKETPHYSTFSQNYIRRFQGTDIFEKIFVNIVEQVIKYNLVKGETFFTDFTHKKANANKNKFHEEVQKVLHERKLWLEEEINEERKKEFEFIEKVEEKKVKISDTDNESGYYHRDIFRVVGYRSYDQGNTTVRKYKFKYNKEKDYYICPEIKGCCKTQGYRILSHF